MIYIASLPFNLEDTLKRILLIALLSLTFVGCAKFQNQMAADGGYLGSYKGNYIVLRNSGGVIVDVWRLRDVIVQSETSSDGWFYEDTSGNVFHLGGDLKVIRVKNMGIWEQYHDYHSEFEIQTYQQKYAGEQKPAQ